MRCPPSRDISSQNCSKIARSRLPRPCLSGYISGTRARIGKRFSPLDRAGPEVSKNVVKKISRPNLPGRDLTKFESVYLRIAGSTRSAVDQKESPEIASAHAHCDETHTIRFVSTSRTRIRQLRVDWLRCVRDIAVFLLRMRSDCDCTTAHAQTKTPISRRDLNQSMRK